MCVKYYMAEQSEYNVGNNLRLPSNTLGGWTLVYCVSFQPFILFTTVTNSHPFVIRIYLHNLCFVMFFINIFI